MTFILKILHLIFFDKLNNFSVSSRKLEEQISNHFDLQIMQNWSILNSAYQDTRLHNIQCKDSKTFTLATSKCYGKVRVLFSGRQLSAVSARKSHSSGARGLVVRCLLFNPEGSCSNPCICANFFTSIPKQKVLTFSALETSPLSAL